MPDCNNDVAYCGRSRDDLGVRASVCFLVGLMACGEPAVATELRFASPQVTIHTLFESYGVDEVSQAEIDRRMDLGYRFHLVDPATLRACFADWDEPSDEALAGYVFGNLIVAKDDLVASMRDERAEMIVENPERRTRPVIFELSEGAWRIVLEESVPESAQRELRQKWEEAQAAD